MRKPKRSTGIESSYRQCHQSLGWTTSPNADWRRLLMVLSFVIRNLWIVDQMGGRREPAEPATYPMFLARVDLTSPHPTADPPSTPQLAELT